MMVFSIKRVMPTSGIAYVLLLIVGFAAGPRCDSVDSVTAAAFDACLLSGTARFGAQHFLHGLAALAFLVFVGEVWARVQAGQKTTGSLPVLMLTGGVLWSAIWLVGTGLAAAASDPGDFQVNAEGGGLLSC